MSTLLLIVFGVALGAGLLAVIGIWIEEADRRFHQRINDRLYGRARRRRR